MDFAPCTSDQTAILPSSTTKKKDKPHRKSISEVFPVAFSRFSRLGQFTIQVENFLTESIKTVFFSVNILTSATILLSC